MSAGAILRAAKLRGAGIIRAAAAHNKRAIQAELGAGGSIDAGLSCQNECLAGPATPSEIANYARARMGAAGIERLRKDAVRAIEFVVSLAPGQCRDERAFFAGAVQWLAGRFGGAENVLSADIHRDEAAPHLHLLLLPLISGRMVGSDALGGRTKLRELQTAFFEAVCAPYGLKRHAPRLVGESKTRTASAVLAELKRVRDACLVSRLWPLLRDRIEADPAPFAQALGIERPKPSRPKNARTMTDIFISKGRGAQRHEDAEPYRA